MEEIFEGIDDLIEQMRDLVREGDVTFGDDMMLREWLESVMFVGDLAGFILAELDKLKIDEYRRFNDPPRQLDKRDYLNRE